MVQAKHGRETPSFNLFKCNVRLENAFFATGVATGTVKLVSVLTGIVSLELLATL